MIKSIHTPIMSANNSSMNNSLLFNMYENASSLEPTSHTNQNETNNTVFSTTDANTTSNMVLDESTTMDAKEIALRICYASLIFIAAMLFLWLVMCCIKISCDNPQHTNHRYLNREREKKQKKLRKAKMKHQELSDEIVVLEKVIKVLDDFLGEGTSRGTNLIPQRNEDGGNHNSMISDMSDGIGKHGKQEQSEVGYDSSAIMGIECELTNTCLKVEVAKGYLANTVLLTINGEGRVKMNEGNLQDSVTNNDALSYNSVETIDEVHDSETSSEVAKEESTNSNRYTSITKELQLTEHETCQSSSGKFVVNGKKHIVRRGPGGKFQFFKQPGLENCVSEQEQKMTCRNSESEPHDKNYEADESDQSSTGNSTSTMYQLRVGDSDSDTVCDTQYGEHKVNNTETDDNNDIKESTV